MMSAVLVHAWVHGNLHNSKNKHGRFDRGNGQCLEYPVIDVNILESGLTDIFEYFALG